MRTKIQRAPVIRPEPRSEDESRAFGGKRYRRENGEGQSTVIRRETGRLFRAAEPLVTLAKSLYDARGRSNVMEDIGERGLPFDLTAASRFLVHNVHHSTCIATKAGALVGLGHVLPDEDDEPEINPDTGKAKKRKRVPSKAATTLDPLCRYSWQMTLSQLGLDFWNVGNAYLECVRDGDLGPIVGLHWLPGCDVRVVTEDGRGVDSHFLVRGRVGGDIRMARFGDASGLRARLRFTPDIRISEVIHIPMPTILDRWYGMPEWLCATALIELTQALMQHQFDFHQNRGVPEMLLMLTGGRVDKRTWAAITETFDQYVGLGNSHKASVFNIPDPNIVSKVEKLAMDGIANGTFFKDMNEALATAIVSAHRVPPSLAGILIPGKMGAANELSNAIMAFQATLIGPMQEHFETILGISLGGDSAGLGLVRDDFRLRSVVDEIAEQMEKLKPADTMGRMKQELPQASAEGRNLDKGLKKSQPTPEMIAQQIVQAVTSRAA